MKVNELQGRLSTVMEWLYFSSDKLISDPGNESISNPFASKRVTRSEATLSTASATQSMAAPPHPEAETYHAYWRQPRTKFCSRLPIFNRGNGILLTSIDTGGPCFVHTIDFANTRLHPLFRQPYRFLDILKVHYSRNSELETFQKSIRLFRI